MAVRRSIEMLLLLLLTLLKLWFRLSCSLCSVNAVGQEARFGCKAMILSTCNNSVPSAINKQYECDVVKLNLLLRYFWVFWRQHRQLEKGSSRICHSWMLKCAGAPPDPASSPCFRFLTNWRLRWRWTTSPPTSRSTRIRLSKRFLGARSHHSP